MSPAYAAIFANLHAQAFPHEPWDEAAFATLLTQPGMHGFVDARGGFLLLRIVCDEAEIITFGATARRQGIGTALLQQGIAAVREAGVTKIHLEAAADNLAAISLYQKLGFTQAGRRKAYYANGADALTFMLALGKAGSQELHENLSMCAAQTGEQ